MVRYACEMIGETADVSVLTAAEQADEAVGAPVCERHDVSERQRDCCPERACTVQTEGQSPALTSTAPRLPAPDRLFVAALLFVQEQAFAEATRPLVAAGDFENTPSEHVPVRLRTSTYLI